MQDVSYRPLSAEFGLEVDFAAGSEEPSRVFRAMTGLIQACETIDQSLAAGLGAEIRPVLLLENIEAGSITAWLRSVIQTVDDEALRSGDYKKIVGTYLVKGKGRMVEFLEDRQTISNAQEIYDLQAVIRDAARETGMPLLRDSPPVPARDVAESLKILSDATLPLRDGDRANYITSDGTIPVNTKFRVTAESIEAVLTEETITNTISMILKVKKPDFLGESMWDFRYEGKKFPARLSDPEWLREFHDGEVILRPGDALRGVVEVQTRYGLDREVIATHYKILKVEEVIHGN